MGICSTSLNFHIDKGCAYIASTLGEVDSAFYAEDGGVKVHQTQKITAIGGMRACRPTQCLAENDIKPQNFTSSFTP